ncbi:hypothetical protein BD410DRAFT_768034 [Rickenella mellea]|uniref:F-box domain-containing protein n=1 Tax=Rickenella mellea TaxID=50990 RepID=A0A4Y7Q9G9_9AGAM|nr:hypothetical protein BD410DRAFT_768034 [Rickenella mellea]
MRSDDELAILSLPNETLTTIFECLDRQSLVTLLRVCQRLQAVGERILYENIHIVEDVDCSPPSVFTPYRTIACCDTITRQPHRPSLVRTIHVRWRVARPQRYDILLSHSVIPRLRHVLQLAFHLESLELHLPGFGGRFEEILDGCKFRLRNLSLSGPVDRPIEWYLRTQPAIVHLHLADQHKPLKLAREDLPVLETFRGDPRAAASIIPMRPVHGLALSGYEPNEECLLAFAFASKPIRNLDLGGLAITPMLLMAIAKHLSAIECLRLKLALRHTLHFTFSGMMLLEGLTRVLQRFHRLARLDLSPTIVDGIQSVKTEMDELKLCIAWAGVCSTLRRITFPSGTEWTKACDGVWGTHQVGFVSRK